MTKEELCRQIDVFKEMGLGGFHLHVRTGLENEYLSEEYMELIKDTVVKAKSEEMLAWLYDEDRWPSGAAGGLVTKDEKYRSRCLFFTPFKEEKYSGINDYWVNKKENPIACYDVILDSDGFLSSYKKSVKMMRPKAQNGMPFLNWQILQAGIMVRHILIH